jgi:hypothetical protein
MTRRAAILWTGRTHHVLRMVEFQVEAFFESVRKSLQRRIVAVNVRVADRAHGHIRSSELGQMTPRAIFVAGKAGPLGIIISMMATRARGRCMTLTGVQEFRIVEIVSLRVNQGKSKK